MDYPPYPPRAQQTGMNYYLLFAIVFSAVLLANLISTWIIAAAVAEGVKQATVDFAKQFEQSLNQEVSNWKSQRNAETQRIKEVNTSNQAAEKQRRIRSNKGRELEKNCSDWQRAAKELKSRTAEAGSKEHCRKYETYINTGRIISISGD